MSVISAGNTTTTSLTQTADTSGNLVFTTSGGNLVSLTLDTYQISTFASSIKETATVSTANATANVTLNAITQSILYYTGNATANTTINITGNSTVSLNNVMANGQSVSVVFMSTQGNTAYYVNTYQIDGVAVTPKWQGNSAPTSGNARGIDVYSLTAVKTANATYTVLASQTQFA
jgi:predicted HNH restriction endonuclease